MREKRELCCVFRVREKERAVRACVGQRVRSEHERVRSELFVRVWVKERERECRREFRVAAVAW